MKRVVKMARKKLPAAEKAARAHARRRHHIDRRYRKTMRLYTKEKNQCKRDCRAHTLKGTPARRDCDAACRARMAQLGMIRTKQYQKSITTGRKLRGALPDAHKAKIKTSLARSWRRKRRDPEIMKRYKNWQGKTIRGVTIGA